MSSTDGSYAFDDRDNDSVASGTSSGSANKLKRALNHIARLRAESALLQESLDMAKMHDVTTLQDKLRGAQTDLAHVRRLNIELKDRVQTLEGSLFDALRENNNNLKVPSSIPGSSHDGTTATAWKEDPATSHTNSSNSSSNGVATKAKSLIAQAGKQSLSHLQKLVISYEKKNAILQDKINVFEKRTNNGDMNKSDELGISAKLGELSLTELLAKLQNSVLTKSYRNHIENAAQVQIEMSKDVDRRTIDSLIIEVDRLTELSNQYVDNPVDNSTSNLVDKASIDGDGEEEIRKSTPSELGFTKTKEDTPSIVKLWPGDSFFGFIVGVLMAMILPSVKMVIQKYQAR